MRRHSETDIDSHLSQQVQALPVLPVQQEQAGLVLSVPELHPGLAVDQLELLCLLAVQLELLYLPAGLQELPALPGQEEQLLPCLQVVLPGLPALPAVVQADLVLAVPGLLCPVRLERHVLPVVGRGLQLELLVLQADLGLLAVLAVLLLAVLELRLELELEPEPELGPGLEPGLEPELEPGLVWELEPEPAV